MLRKVNFIALYRMTNALHVQFHHAVVAYLTLHTAEGLGLESTLIDGYSRAVANEQTMVNRTLASAVTPDVQEADALRDRTLRYVIGQIRNTRYSQVAEVRGIYPSLKALILDRYPLAICAAAGQEETAQIRGLIIDLQANFRTDLTRIGLAEAVTQLAAANDRFEELFLARNSSQALYVPGRMLAARALCDELYGTVAQMVGGQANLTTADEARQAVYDTAATCTDQLNTLVRGYQIRLDQVAAGQPSTTPATDADTADPQPSTPTPTPGADADGTTPTPTPSVDPDGTTEALAV